MLHALRVRIKINNNNRSSGKGLSPVCAMRVLERRDVSIVLSRLRVGVFGTVRTA